MKNSIVLLVFGYFLNVINLVGQVPVEIQDPLIIGTNKLPPRTSVWPSSTIDKAIESDYDNSDWVHSLNGDWRFKWSPDPDSRPADFYKLKFNTQDWPEIPVPSTVERQGYGVPLYVNIKYPFKVNPPRVMDEPDPQFTNYDQRNPVSSYVRMFHVPEDWSDKQIILHFAGISSAAFVWINGQEVGYTQGSRLPAEFDISSYLVAGENKIAVEVYKYCDGSYLEDQDFWRLSGIFRDVFIRAVPKATLWDVYAAATVDINTKRGAVSVHCTPANFTGQISKKHSISVSVISPSNDLIASRDYDIQDIRKGINDEFILPEIEIPKAKLWWQEMPNEYTVQVVLKRKKNTTEVYRLPVGFRKIEVLGEQLLFNGLPLKIRGVNRHEFSPDQGYVVSKEQMTRELELMKLANINFVRTSHYPNDPRWYNLCNKFGMMVLDEANIETHELSYHKKVLPGDEPEWAYGCVDRMKRMVIRDRQQPSVVMWSLGNEAGFGQTYVEMRQITNDNDPEKRLIQYADMNLVGDFDSQTYPSITWINQHLEGKALRKGERGEKTFDHQHGKYPSGRPFVMNEYCHAMGNSLGNISDYWKQIYAHNMLAGGFIWDWIDQSLYKNPLNPDAGWAYGGDFGDFPNDGNFNVNGLIGADLKPHPHYEELKKVYQPIYMDLVSIKPLTIEVSNHHLYSNTNQFQFSYKIRQNGVVIQERVLADIQCAPTKAIQAFIEDVDFSEVKETFITFYFSLKQDCLWADQGHVVAWEQFKLSDGVIRIDKSIAEGMVNLEESTAAYAISGQDFSVIINKSSGLISNYQYQGKEVIAEDVKFNFWRALTDNDMGWDVREKMGVWENEAENYTLKQIRIDSSFRGQITMESSYIFNGTKSESVIKHTFYPDGSIQFDVSLIIPEEAPNVPRLGLQFQLNKSLTEIEWYGRGPHENYVDRTTSAAIGIYKMNLEDFITHYVRPQENANRCDVRWIKFGNNNNEGFDFMANSDHTLSVSAWPYQQKALAQAQHDQEISLGKYPVVNIDYKQMGVGGDNSWGLPVMDKYQIHPGKYSYGFTLQPAKKQE